MELQRVIDEFLQYTRLEKCASPLTLQAYASDLRMFSRHWEALGLPSRTDRVTTAMVRRCLFAIHEERTYKPATVNRRYDTVRSMFAFAVDQGDLEANPMDKIKSPKLDKALPVYLRPDELERLLATLRASDGSTGSGTRPSSTCWPIPACGALRSWHSLGMMFGSMISPSGCRARAGSSGSCP